jgi:sugar O-acyltransferase (sialic acid O-acetyltransferase NeuD family)
MNREVKQPLIIIGLNGNAYDILDIIEAVNAQSPRWVVVGLLDDNREAGSMHQGLMVLGPLREAPRWDKCLFISAIGSDRSFRERPAIVAATGLEVNQFATLVHPAAAVSRRAKLGRGVYVNYGASIGGGVVVGSHVAVGPGAIIGHDTVIEDHTIVAPGAVVSGFVHLEGPSYIGARAAIRQRLRVGARALVGMGAVVVRDVAPGTTVIGNPARALSRERRRPTGKAAPPLAAAGGSL